MTPQRIQRKRTKGWRKPENTVIVQRPGKWGNPFKNPEDPAWAVSQYKNLMLANPELCEEAKKELRGKNLSCTCPLNKPCHADVLLEIANA